MPYEPTQARRIAAGLCKDCGNDRGEDGTSLLCRPCADRQSGRQSARKSQLRERWAADDAVCNGCGTELPDEQFKNCKSCREYTRKYHHSYGKERRANRRGSGICVDCARPSTHASNYCRTHWLRSTVGRYGFTRDEYGLMWAKLEAQNFQCYYTGVDLVPGVNASLDHRVPRSRGGDPLDPDNCVWCDRLINAFKNDLTDEEFVGRCRMVVERIG